MSGAADNAGRAYVIIPVRTIGDDRYRDLPMCGKVLFHDGLCKAGADFTDGVIPFAPKTTHRWCELTEAEADEAFAALFASGILADNGDGTATYSKWDVYQESNERLLAKRAGAKARKEKHEAKVAAERAALAAAASAAQAATVPDVEVEPAGELVLPTVEPTSPPMKATDLLNGFAATIDDFVEDDPTDPVAGYGLALAQAHQFAAGFQTLPSPKFPSACWQRVLAHAVERWRPDFPTKSLAGLYTAADSLGSDGPHWMILALAETAGSEPKEGASLVGWLKGAAKNAKERGSAQ